MLEVKTQAKSDDSNGYWKGNIRLLSFVLFHSTLTVFWLAFTASRLRISWTSSMDFQCCCYLVQWKGNPQKQAGICSLVTSYKNVVLGCGVTENFVYFLNPRLIVNGVLYSFNIPLVHKNGKYSKHKHCGVSFLHSGWKWLKSTASEHSP